MLNLVFFFDLSDRNVLAVGILGVGKAYEDLLVTRSCCKNEVCHHDKSWHRQLQHKIVLRKVGSF